MTSTHARALPLALALLLGAAPLALAQEGAGARDDAAPASAPADAAAPALSLGQVTGDEVRVRAGPSINFRVMERLPRGTWVEIAGEDGEFLRVRIPGGVPVFLHRDLVTMESDEIAVVDRSDVLMRPTAGKDYFPLEGQRLQKGDRLRLLKPGMDAASADDEWLRVLPPETVEYFVHRSLVASVPTPDDWEKERERVALSRRDGYTGGSEAEAAREADRRREEGFARTVQAAADLLTSTPAEAMPEGLDRAKEDLRTVMTESGDGDTRARAAAIARELLLREKTVELARLKAEKASVKEDLQARLEEAEARYRESLKELLKAAPERETRRFLAVGILRRDADGYYLEKGGVVLHRVDSLRYDLEEMLGRRVGVNGKRIEVDPRMRLALLRIDAIEIVD